MCNRLDEANITMLGTTIPKQHDYDAMHKLQCWALQYPSSTITMQCTRYNAGHYNTQAARLRCNAQVTMLGTTIPKQHDYDAMHKLQCWALQYPSSTITMQCTSYNAVAGCRLCFVDSFVWRTLPLCHSTA